MEGVALIVRLLLAGVFFLAGIAKLVDRQGSIDALTEFGIPITLGRPVGFFYR